MATLTGIRPTGRLHFGHYASVIKPALENPDMTVLVAGLHAPNQNAKTDMVKALRKYGVTNIKLQSLDEALLFRLLEVTPAHLLNAMPQYKSAKDKNTLMYVYPVLMAHDMVGYDRVLVGIDQKPHIELARDILPRVGLACPEPIYQPVTIMDLRHPTQKMSKSDPMSCLFLDDADYERKIMRAVTDEAGRANLIAIYTLLGGDSGEHLRSLDNKHLKLHIIEMLRGLINDQQ